MGQNLSIIEQPSLKFPGSFTHFHQIVFVYGAVWSYFWNASRRAWHVGIRVVSFRVFLTSAFWERFETRSRYQSIQFALSDRPSRHLDRLASNLEETRIRLERLSWYSKWQPTQLHRLPEHSSQTVLKLEQTFWITWPTQAVLSKKKKKKKSSHCIFY